MMKVALVGLACIVGTAMLANAADADKCSAESMGLKYTQIEGSFIASAMFLPFMLAMSPVVYPYDKTGKYECSVKVVAKDITRFHKQKGG